MIFHCGWRSGDAICHSGNRLGYIEESNDHPTVCSSLFFLALRHTDTWAKECDRVSKLSWCTRWWKTSWKKKGNWAVWSGYVRSTWTNRKTAYWMQRNATSRLAYGEKKNGCNSISHWDAGDERKTRRNAATDRSGPCEVSEGKWEWRKIGQKETTDKINNFGKLSFFF